MCHRRIMHSIRSEAPPLPAFQDTRDHVRAELDGDDRRISERIAPALRRDGLFFVGIDVIGGFLTEVNLTSPTGVQEINRLEDRHLEVEILDGVERKLAEHRAGS